MPFLYRFEPIKPFFYNHKLYEVFFGAPVRKIMKSILAILSESGLLLRITGAPPPAATIVVVTSAGGEVRFDGDPITDGLVKCLFFLVTLGHW